MPDTVNLPGLLLLTALGGGGLNPLPAIVGSDVIAGTIALGLN